MVNINVIWSEVEKIFKNDASGHDYWHTVRVHKNALKIVEKEARQCSKELVELLALLHDVDDAKLFSTKNYENARRIMKEAGIDEDQIEFVVSVIDTISFKGEETTVPDCVEGKIVQDADRLDAMGAIGIARAFYYGGNKKRCMHNPKLPPNILKTKEMYLKNDGTTINHFYEKLFLLKEKMNTETAREIAEERDFFMHQFIDEFYREWDE